MQKLGRDVGVGDILMFLGKPHMISSIKPYKGNKEHLWAADGGARVAEAEPGWGGITLDPTSTYEILSATGAAAAQTGGRSA